MANNCRTEKRFGHGVHYCRTARRVESFIANGFSMLPVLLRGGVS
ncbi:hypothetical protein [Streptomyces sp. SYSU K21746]